MHQEQLSLSHSNVGGPEGREGERGFAPGQRVKREVIHERQPWLNKTHYGTVLRENDPEAWVGTLAFPRGVPSQEAVDAHLARTAQLFREHGIEPSKTIAVRWDYGMTYWERPDGLTPAE